MYNITNLKITNNKPVSPLDPLSPVSPLSPLKNNFKNYEFKRGSRDQSIMY